MMRIRFVAIGAAVIAMVAAHVDLRACGDKFLLPARGARFDRAPTRRQPGAILLYARDGSEFAGALNRSSAIAALQKAGYAPRLVASGDELDSALRQERWTLVLFDLSDAQSVRACGAADAPIALPVVYAPAMNHLAQARGQYSSVLKNPTKSQAFLDSIDTVLDARPGSQTRISTSCR